MILSDASDKDLEEMRSRLMMEGVFNRDSKIRELCQKILSVLEDVTEAMWQAREYARMTEGDLSDDDRARIVTNTKPALTEHDLTGGHLSTRFWDKHRFIMNVMSELRQLLKDT